MTMIRIHYGDYDVELAPLGAELQRLQWRGLDLLWEGDPRWWGRRAPVLFPIVGRLAGDTLRHEGRQYPLHPHGFARDMAWEVVEVRGDGASFLLHDTDETRLAFPFAFELMQRIRLSEAGLEATFILSNPGVEDLFACLGAHPAFRWPLPGARREDHEIIFETPEPEPIRRLQDGLLRHAPEPSPVMGARLALTDTLFAEDALIFDRLHSRRLLYTAPGAPRVELTWDFPHFGIWTKPGAPFLCLEPWQGYADAEGERQIFHEKSGVVRLAGGERRTWSYRISVREGLP